MYISIFNMPSRKIHSNTVEPDIKMSSKYKKKIKTRTTNHQASVYSRNQMVKQSTVFKYFLHLDQSHVIYIQNHSQDKYKTLSGVINKVI